MAHIGLDYTPAYEQGGGIGRYVRELTNALFQLDTEHYHQYRLFVAGGERAQLPRLYAKPQITYEWKTTPLTTRWLARLWYRARLQIPVESITGPLDLYHATDFVLPPTQRTTKTILTVHDLSFVKTPETASPRLREYLNQVVPRSVARADYILADSQATRQDVIDLYGVTENKIEVLLSGVSPRFYQVVDKKQIHNIREKYGVPDGPFIFAVGTIQPRKNYERLIKAVAQLRGSHIDMPVVIAGGRGWLENEIYKAIEKHKMQERIYFIGFVDDDDLPQLYSAAHVVWFVSLYEGFGLPVLESMACGTPVLTSNVSSLPEVAGDAALMVAPTDDEAIVDGLNQLILDTELRSTLIENGYKQAAQFSWEKAAQQLLATYNRMLAD